MCQGYIYKSGKLSIIDGVHSDTIGDIDQALINGIVRIRDHGQVVAFQGVSKYLVLKAVDKFKTCIKYPDTICMEWPGNYKEIKSIN